MVFAFFKKDDSGIGHIATRAVGMLNDARHSYDLATLAFLGGASLDSVKEDVRSTDQRINQTEQDLRSELVVHVSVQGTQEIALVMGYTLLIKKIERIGDQAKNILDLAEEVGSISGGEDASELMAERQEVSTLFADAAALLADSDAGPDVQSFTDRTGEIGAKYQEKINELMHSDLPGHVVVPRAIYFRYLKRIVANLRGVVSTASEPLPHIDYLDGGATDITDD
jgi:hypothetical protein